MLSAPQGSITNPFNEGNSLPSGTVSSGLPGELGAPGYELTGTLPQSSMVAPNAFFSRLMNQRVGHQEYEDQAVVIARQTLDEAVARQASWLQLAIPLVYTDQQNFVVRELKFESSVMEQRAELDAPNLVRWAQSERVFTVNRVAQQVQMEKAALMQTGSGEAIFLGAIMQMAQNLQNTLNLRAWQEILTAESWNSHWAQMLGAASGSAFQRGPGPTPGLNVSKIVRTEVQTFAAAQKAATEVDAVHALVVEAADLIRRRSRAEPDILAIPSNVQKYLQLVDSQQTQYMMMGAEGRVLRRQGPQAIGVFGGLTVFTAKEVVENYQGSLSENMLSRIRTVGEYYVCDNAHLFDSIFEGAVNGRPYRYRTSDSDVALYDQTKDQFVVVRAEVGIKYSGIFDTKNAGFADHPVFQQFVTQNPPAGNAVPEHMFIAAGGRRAATLADVDARFYDGRTLLASYLTYLDSQASQGAGGGGGGAAPGGPGARGPGPRTPVFSDILVRVAMPFEDATLTGFLADLQRSAGGVPLSDFLLLNNGDPVSDFDSNLGALLRVLRAIKLMAVYDGGDAAKTEEYGRALQNTKFEVTVDRIRPSVTIARTANGAALTLYLTDALYNAPAFTGAVLPSDEEAYNRLSDTDKRYFSVHLAEVARIGEGRFSATRARFQELVRLNAVDASGQLRGKHAPHLLALPSYQHGDEHALGLMATYDGVASIAENGARAGYPADVVARARSLARRAERAGASELTRVGLDSRVAERMGALSSSRAAFALQNHDCAAPAVRVRISEETPAAARARAPAPRSSARLPLVDFSAFMSGARTPDTLASFSNLVGTTRDKPTAVELGASFGGQTALPRNPQPDAYPLAMHTALLLDSESAAAFRAACERDGAELVSRVMLAAAKQLSSGGGAATVAVLRKLAAALPAARSLASWMNEAHTALSRAGVKKVTDAVGEVTETYATPESDTALSGQVLATLANRYVARDSARAPEADEILACTRALGVSVDLTSDAGVRDLKQRMDRDLADDALKQTAARLVQLHARIAGTGAAAASAPSAETPAAAPAREVVCPQLAYTHLVHEATGGDADICPCDRATYRALDAEALASTGALGGNAPEVAASSERIDQLLEHIEAQTGVNFYPESTPQRNAVKQAIGTGLNQAAALAAEGAKYRRASNAPAAAAFLSLRIDSFQSIYDDFISQNVLFPFTLLYARPMISHYMSSMVLMASGADLGMTVFGMADTQAGMDSQRKNFTLHFNATIGAIITDPKRLMVVRDVSVDEYVGGRNTEVVDPGADGDSAAYNAARLMDHDMHRPSLFCMLVPSSDRVKGQEVLALFGDYPYAAFQSYFGRDSRYSYHGTPYYQKLWPLMVNSRRMDNYTYLDQALMGDFNSMCMPGLVRLQDTRTHTFAHKYSSTGHFDDSLSMPGAAPRLNGQKTARPDPVQIPMHTPIAV